MKNIINLGIPHVGEKIFRGIDTPGLIKCLEVSQTWKELAGNVLVKRWKGKMFEACRDGETKVVQLLLEHYNSEESGNNIRGKCGKTALMAACINGHRDVVQLLLDYSERTELNTRSNKENFVPIILFCAQIIENYDNTDKTTNLRKTATFWVSPSHYSTSLFSVQKFNFDKTSTFS